MLELTSFCAFIPWAIRGPCRSTRPPTTGPLREDAPANAIRDTPSLAKLREENTPWMGAGAEALRALNDRIVKDARVAMLRLTIGDGLTLCRRRG